MMKEHGIVIADNIEDYALNREKKGNTAIFAAVDSELLAVISIADKIRDDAKEALKR